MGCPDENAVVEFAIGSLPAARREQLARHIDACDACGMLVAEAARDSGPPTPNEPISAAGQRGRGTGVGRYVLLELLGTGGLGEVYAAFDPDLERKVALKLVRIVAEDPTARREQRERMLDEARALAKLAHPNVVAVHDVGLVDEQVFIAMELIEGETLAHWIHTVARSWSDARDVLVQAGHGLAAAHAAGLVHRDFKPQNVLRSADGRVRVADFGLAQRSVQSAAHAAGTPAYMAPEQAAGRAVDARADQFSFCVTLHEALHGVRPGAEAGDERRIPVWLRRAVRRGLAQDPAARFVSMESLLHALVRDRRSRRRQLGVLALTAVVSAGVAWGVSAWRDPQVVAAAEAEVDRLARLARESAARAEFVHPPPDDPRGATAYSRVLELEALDEAPGAPGRATALRTEFATTLARLGDRYWDQPGGAAFATDYYAAALVFDPSLTQARQRSRLTRGELAQLERDASERAFSAAELQAALTLVALAPDDLEERARRLQALLRGPNAPSPATTTRLEGLLGRENVGTLSKPRVAAARPRPSPSTAPATAEPSGAAAPTIPPGASEPPGLPARVDGAAADQAPAARTRTARTLAAEGQQLLRAGNVDAAARRFHQALGADRRNRAALNGLYEIAFQRGAYKDAVQHATRLVGLGKGNAGDHRRLGDAYFKVLRYADAERAYLKAKALGAKNVDSRLAKLRRRLGDGAG